MVNLDRLWRGLARKHIPVLIAQTTIMLAFLGSVFHATAVTFGYIVTCALLAVLALVIKTKLGSKKPAPGVCVLRIL